MDAHHGHQGPPHLFARPAMNAVSQPAIASPSFPPIPPPPYSSQSAVPRHHPTPRHDPFLPSYPRYNTHVSSPAFAQHASPFPASYDTLYSPRYGASPPSPRNGTVGWRLLGNNMPNTKSVGEEHQRGSQQDDCFYTRHPHSSTNPPTPSQRPQLLHSAHVVPPPPPPSASSSTAMYHPANGNVVAPPFGGAAASTMFRASTATSPTSPPPPPPFAGRPMPPPTSPRSRSSTETAATAPIVRTASQPSTSTKDLKTLASTLRPGSSMSISSMLGADVEPHPRDSTQSSRVKERSLGSFASSTNITPHRPSSPQRHPVKPLSRDMDMPGNGRSQWAVDAQAREQPTYNLAHSESASRNGTGSLPQDLSNGPPHHRSRHPDHVHSDLHRNAESYPSFREHAKDVSSDQRLGMSSNGVQGPGDSQLKMLTQSMSPIQKRGAELKGALDAGHWQSKREVGEGCKPAASQRVELSGVDGHPPPTSRDANTEKRSFINYLADQGPRPAANYPFLARAPQGSPRDAQNGFGVKPSVETSQDVHRHGSRTPITQDALQHTRDSKYATFKSSDVETMRLNGDTPMKHVSSFPWRAARDSPRLNIPPQSKSTDPTMDSRSGPGLDLPEQSKSSLGLRIDENRRGRISPLPQAVQGAQARLEGPATEPNIKNEFARIFPGIGSGVGSNMNTPAPPDSATPMSIPSSPTTRTEDAGRNTPSRTRDGFIELVRQSNSGKKAVRKSRKVKDENGKAENSLPPRRGEGSARGTKRSRPGHHHHSHGYHHHHPFPDAMPVLTGFASANASKRILTPTLMHSTNPSSTNAPPHHHHHHHHHHSSKPGVPAAVKKPKLTIDNSRVLAAVAGAKRQNLGSTLYEPVLQNAPSTILVDGAPKFGLASLPKPIPRFEGKENCIFTVRVPRYHMRHGQREEICQTRVLWGTDVYTDDSDPIAAAIHSGWIRGAWGEDVDISLLDLGDEIETLQSPEDKNQDGDELVTHVSTLPLKPMVPPWKRDLHINLVLLPRLESYSSTTRYGVQSREWKAKLHDGMSFMVESIAWVDEKASRGEERGGEARRKRLKTLNGSRTLATGTRIHLDAFSKSFGGVKTASAVVAAA